MREVFVLGWQSRIHDALPTMLEKSYHVAPIVGEGVLEGVFTQTLLVEILVTRGGIDLTGEVVFDRFRTACSLERPHRDVLLRPETLTIPEAECDFAEAFHRQVALSALLLTEQGRPGEPLLGLVTAFDLPSATGKQFL
ncbi:MAG: hypothetical protein RBU45_24955 [Myxococcota bacterium]|nr:hypothetical protein [Myxococcota bacterium]